MGQTLESCAGGVASTKVYTTADCTGPFEVQNWRADGSCVDAFGDGTSFYNARCTRVAVEEQTGGASSALVITIAVVAGAFVLLIILGITFVCCRRRKKRMNLAQLTSPASFQSTTIEMSSSTADHIAPAPPRMPVPPPVEEKDVAVEMPGPPPGPPPPYAFKGPMPPAPQPPPPPETSEDSKINVVRQMTLKDMLKAEEEKAAPPPPEAAEEAKAAKAAKAASAEAVDPYESIKKKLELLKNAHASGLITDEEYAAKKEIVLKELEGGGTSAFA